MNLSGLTDKEKSRLQLLLDDIKAGGNYFVIKSGQPSQKITVNVDLYLGRVPRTIETNNGNVRTINHHTFRIWNQTYSRIQTLQLSDRWIKRLFKTMLVHNTNTVSVTRTGDSVFNTNYEFKPEANESSNQLYEMAKKEVWFESKPKSTITG